MSTRVTGGVLNEILPAYLGSTLAIDLRRTEYIYCTICNHNNKNRTWLHDLYKNIKVTGCTQEDFMKIFTKPSANAAIRKLIGVMVCLCRQYAIFVLELRRYRNKSINWRTKSCSWCTYEEYKKRHNIGYTYSTTAKHETIVLCL